MQKYGRLILFLFILIGIFFVGVIVGVKYSSNDKEAADRSLTSDKEAADRSLTSEEAPPAGAPLELVKVKIGYQDNDANPITGAIKNWGYKGGFAFDYLLRSIGVDLGSKYPVKKIKLISSKERATRLTKENLEIYFSQDNLEFTRYTKEVDYIDTIGDPDHEGVRVLILDSLSITARYIKLHQTYDDEKYTFVNGNLQDIVEVFAVSATDGAKTKPVEEPVLKKSIKKPPAPKEKVKAVLPPDNLVKKREIVVGYRDEDADPTIGAIKNWGYKGSFAFDYLLRSIGVDLGSKHSVKKMKLISSKERTRLIKENLEIYFSQDNREFTRYTKEWDFINTLKDPEHKGVMVLILDNLSITARYIKVRQTYKDKNYTFVNGNLQDIIEVFPVSAPDGAKTKPVEEPVLKKSIKQPPAPEEKVETVLSPESLVKKSEIVVGHRDEDADPTIGTIKNWGYKGGFAFDYLLRSVGVDLGSKHSVKKMKLISSKERTRLIKENLEIYFSQDNREFTRYTKEWDFINTLKDSEHKAVRVLILDNLSITARYIKVRQTYKDKDYTFVNGNLQDIIEVFTVSAPDGAKTKPVEEPVLEKSIKQPPAPEEKVEAVLSPESLVKKSEIVVGHRDEDADPTIGTIKNWDYKGGVAFDYLLRSVGVDLGSKHSVKKIKLISSKERETRLTKENLEIYFSQDNREFTRYTKEWDFINTLKDPEHKAVRVLILDNLSITARYIKVRQTYKDKDYTFVNGNLQDIVEVFTVSAPDEVKP